MAGTGTMQVNAHVGQELEVGWGLEELNLQKSGCLALHVGCGEVCRGTRWTEHPGSKQGGNLFS